MNGRPIRANFVPDPVQCEFSDLYIQEELCQKAPVTSVISYSLCASAGMISCFCGFQKCKLIKLNILSCIKILEIVDQIIILKL